MEKTEVIENYKEYVVGCYSKTGLVFVRGKGSRLWDIDGKEYLDFFPGWAVSGLGHCHPAVVEAVREQSALLMHIANNHYHPWQGTLGKKLSGLSFGGKAFFCNSGAEANETAIKLARLYGRKRGKYKIISMLNSFHGRTLATVTMTGQPKYSDPFKPLPPGFSYVPFNDFEALEKAVDEETAAVMIEPVQGEGGVNVADRDYLKKTAGFCKEKGVLLMFDEVQTGFGRTGKFFAYEHFDVIPDVMTIAKTFGGGFPVGAMLAGKDIAGLLEPGTHASTFGGSPLACVSCMAVIHAIEKDNLLENVNAMGKYLEEKLNGLKDKYPSKINKVKGLGVMLALEMAEESSGLVEKCADAGLLINCTHGNVLRIMPSLCVNRNEIDEAAAILNRVISGGQK